MEDEYDYYEGMVMKKSYTPVYLKVPKNRTITFADTKLLGIAAKKTTDSSDWDDWGWEKDVGINEIRKVSENDATAYPVYEVTDDNFKN